jgi:DNA-binding transcriptional regulator PaaX
MVVNPKKYQDFVWFGLETIVTAFFEVASKTANKIATDDLKTLISDELNIKDADSRHLSKSIYELKRSGYLERDGASVVLTDKAKMKIVDKIASKIKNDKRNYLVSFDIPEPMKRNRNSFRRTIKRIGFAQIQKSLWVINKDVGELVDIAIKENGVEDYVAYFVSEVSSIDKFISNKINNSGNF